MKNKDMNHFTRRIWTSLTVQDVCLAWGKIVTAKARVQSQSSPRGQSGTKAGLPPCNSVFHSTNVPYSYVITLIIRGLSNRPISGRSTKMLSLTPSPMLVLREDPTDIASPQSLCSLFLCLLMDSEAMPSVITKKVPGNTRTPTKDWGCSHSSSSALSYTSGYVMEHWWNNRPFQGIRPTFIPQPP